MKKVIVIGSPGSGKTTFCEKLNRVTNLPIFYLDAIWWNPDKTHISRDEFDKRLDDIFKFNMWIIDGNYQRTIERRIKECDTVFLFDLPTQTCIDGAVSRIGKTRNDVPFIDKEFDPHLKEEIEKFKEESLPEIYNLLNIYKEGREIIIFKSREDADNYIQNLLLIE